MSLNPKIDQNGIPILNEERKEEIKEKNENIEF